MQLVPAAAIGARLVRRSSCISEEKIALKSKPLVLPDFKCVSLRVCLPWPQDPDHRLPLAKVLHHPWLTAGSALPPLRSCQQVKLRAEREEEAAEQDRERLQQEQMLREALQGLVSGECEVQSFARGQTLMTRGQTGTWRGWVGACVRGCAPVWACNEGCAEELAFAFAGANPSFSGLSYALLY